HHSPRIPNFVPILAAAGVAGAVAWAWWRPFRVAVEGRSMSPALEDGDFLVATARGRIRRGTLVVVRHPERQEYEMVKRVTGLGGGVRGGQILGAGEYWVEGDSPERSTDSRSFGPITREDVAGMGRIRYSPVSPARWGAPPIQVAFASSTSSERLELNRPPATPPPSATSLVQPCPTRSRRRRPCLRA